MSVENNDSVSPAFEEIVRQAREILYPTLLNHIYLMEDSDHPKAGVVVSDTISNRG